MQGLDLEQLRTFLAVLDAGSLTAAAPRVFLSQSAVSEQMRKLEERAGQGLLSRSKTGVVPTAAGERLRAHAQRLVALADEALRDLRGESLQGELRLAVTDYFRPGELTRLLGEVFAKRTTAEWVELLEAAGVPNGPINHIAQVYDEPQVKARGVRVELTNVSGIKVPLVASPMRFSETPIEYRLAPPALGQHTDEVLRGLGKNDADIARLRDAGVI